GIGNVFAVDGKTGVVKWKYQSGGRPGTNRGVAVGDGKVFAGQRDNSLVALDQNTGARLWRTADDATVQSLIPDH
ncbi:MAG TPA: PQQ-binding-like beta-propeller repeat protein, partial [Vicinamibacterales bacterium]|nr:PQQ-binding-like beta-propeller repeat protein [Vicinamibacterales bacterium]